MQQSPERQPEIKELFFFRKKNEVLKLSSITANLTTNNAREVFSRVPLQFGKMTDLEFKLILEFAD
jgi:Fe(3+) dicitrate transport protein